MPREEKDIVEKSVDAKEAGEEHATQSEHILDEKVQHRGHMGLMVAGIVVGILLIFAVIGVAGNMFLRVRSGFINGSNSTTTFVQRGRSHMMGRMFIETSSNMTSGVVISVNGSNFVIAGNGNQFTVNTTGDTTYNTTSKKVTVNDSVIVVGKITDKIITATDVRILNQ